MIANDALYVGGKIALTYEKKCSACEELLSTNKMYGKTSEWNMIFEQKFFTALRICFGEKM